MTREDTEKLLQETYDTIAMSLVRDFKHTDMSLVAKQMARGELIEAYVSVLNMEADFLGQGGLMSSEEYKDIKTMKQNCEHWIAKRVLDLSGWKEKGVTRYFKEVK